MGEKIKLFLQNIKIQFKKLVKAINRLKDCYNTLMQDFNIK